MTIQELAEKDKKFLIVADEPVSTALVQTLSLLYPSYFEKIDSLKFSDSELLINELEKFKDEKNLQGIILSEPDGVDLAKHIRLSDTLGILRLMPITVLSATPLRYHLKERKDNVFLLSPGCYTIPVSRCVTELLSAVDEMKSFESLDEMSEEIRPFVIWSEEDEVTSRHDNFNRYGPFKLLKEHFGHLPERLSGEYERITRSLWFKKYQFLEAPTILQQTKETIDEETFQKTVRNKKVLYIDDEHRLGWSFALYSIITGSSDSDAHEALQKAEHFIASPDNRLTCIDRYTEAKRLFEDYKQLFIEALNRYSEAENIKNLISEQYDAARRSFTEAERKYKNAKENLKRTETNLRETEERLKAMHDKLKSFMDNFAEAYISGTEDIKVTEVQPQIEGMTDKYGQWKKEADALLKYKEEYKRNSELFENLKNAFERHEQASQEAQSKKSEATKQYDDALGALSPGRLFPFDLVILDLRLEKAIDKEVQPHEISGIRLLREIKECDPSIPVIIFTASQKAINYKEAVDLGASGYWIKAINSSSDLKNEIVKSISNTRDVRNLWLDIKKVETKKQLTCKRENTYTRMLEKVLMDSNKKSEIIRFLKESFLMLQREPAPYEKSVCNYDNYSKISLNMGLILEERFGNIRNEKWEKWVRENKIDKDEITIRQTRNKAAHRTGSRISKEEALKVFQLTLKRCLMS